MYIGTDFFQLAKRKNLKSLGKKYGFKFFEFNCTEDFVTGILTFERFLDAYEFYREGVQYSDIEFYHGWYESYSGKIATKLIRDISIKLNEDCIDEIAKQLDIISFADLFSRCSSSRLNKIAGRRFATLVINRTTVGRAFGLLNMYYVLLVMGDIVTNITIALDSFRGGHTMEGNKKLMYSILYHVHRLTGHKLKSVSLQNFQINMNIPYFRSIINKLQQRHVVINIE